MLIVLCDNKFRPNFLKALLWAEGIWRNKVAKKAALKP